MADDEEYYFENDDYDDGAEEEVTWETEIENLYATTKSTMDRHPAEAVKGFLQVVDDDQDKGRWTFKAYKQLCRCYQKLKDWGNMLKYYKTAISFNYGGRTRNDVEKAINKFLERCSQCDVSVLLQLYNTTLEVINQDRRNYEKIWFNVKMKVAQIAFEEAVRAPGAPDFKPVNAMLTELKEWALEGENPVQRKGTSLLAIYALQIQISTELEELTELRGLYNNAISIKSVIVPPKLMGIIHECGGKMYMRQSQWQEAYDAFFAAFRGFDEAGHPSRIACLKYLLLATMLSAAKINPFDTEQAKCYQNDPEIVAMRDLISACENNDVKRFQRVLTDKRNAQSIMQDKFLKSYLDPLVRKIRCEALLVTVKPYRNITLDFIAKQLTVTPKEAEGLLVSMILDGRLKGMIDQMQGVLYVQQADEATGARYSLLEKWASQQEVVQKMLVRRAMSAV